jgi:hypothetical protein
MPLSRASGGEDAAFQGAAEAQLGLGDAPSQGRGAARTDPTGLVNDDEDRTRADHRPQQQGRIGDHERDDQVAQNAPQPEEIAASSPLRVRNPTARLGEL